MLAPIARPVLRIVAIGVLATIGHTTTAAESVDSDRGILPLGAEGRPLNFDFETGTLDDWTVRGEAFQDQPVEGDTVATRRGDMKSRHTGKFWIGGFERKGDAPHGTLTSVPFRVTHPFASFRIGGGQLNATRVELVGKETGEVFFRASGGNLEDMHPVVVDLGGQQGKEIFIRLVDAHGGGWGHVNFDDFRFHQQRPEFPDAIKMASVVDQYPYGDLSPADAARVMKLPSGFSVTAFAGEPEVRQPIAMAIDDRGRLWVAEAYEYPRRAPDGKGRDRILILEDTDGDGVHDRRTVFQEHLNLVSGLEVGFGGVWVGAAPTLLFIPDADGDDQPDGPPQVLLDGWAYQDTHETLNAFIWGPDGWLYGCHGVFTHSRVGKPGTPEEQRIPLNGAIWRYHPTRHTFEVFAHGTSNPWGVDFDDHGQAFCTACVIPHLFHVIQGARYRRQAGGHFNPYTYDDIKTIADHRHYAGAVPHAANNRSDSAGGGHAHAGAMIYLGNTWPAPYRGKIFMNNIHGQRINMDVLEPAGSGFVGSHGPDFLFTGDRWSQIVNLRYGPDGQVLMIDWYDQQACHTGNISDHDRGNGRVFQVRYGDGKSSSIDLKQKSDRELVKLQLHANDWFVRHARRILAERAAAGKLDPNARHDLLTMARSNPDAARRLRAMWALHVTGRLPADLVPALLVDESPYVRGWTIQLVLEAPAPHPPEELLREFADMARHDPSPVVRLYLASAAQRIDLENRWGIVEGLLTHAEDAHDHNLPLMIWYALEPLAGHDPARALALVMGAEDAFPQLREFVVRRIASGEGGEPIELLVTAMGKSERPDQVRTLMAGLHTALRGQRDVAAPPLWAKVYRQLTANGEPDLRFQAILLGAVFGDRQAMAALRQVAGDQQAKQADRQRAVRTLLTARDPKLVAVLQTLLHDTRLLSTAIKGLAAYNDAETPRRILAVYATLAPQQRREALATFAARPSYAMALLDAVEKKQIAASDLTADLIRQLRNLGDQRLNDRITEVWGTVRNTTKERAETIATIKAMLERRGKRAPDPMLGRALFAKTCQQCHTLFGTGGRVGPELTGSNRANLDYVLSNVIDPSAVMAKEYQPSIVATDDGRIVTGIVRASDAKTITVQTADELLVLAKDAIEDQKLSSQSMMPNDQLRPFSQHEIRSLVTYLASPNQVPMLATPANVASLFNGVDLAGWQGDDALWHVEGSEIVGRSPGIGHNAFLIRDLAVDDFQLSLEVKLVGDRGNSGIQFRSRPIPDGLVRGYQADIGAGWWGKLYEEHGRGLLWSQPGDAHVRKGEWNRYDIRAVGDHVQTWINGVPCVDLKDPDGARRGILALQIHSGEATEVRFRNLQLAVVSARQSPFAASTVSSPGEAIRFRKTQLDDRFRSEGVAVGDFNHDGKQDIAAGSLYYTAPGWERHTLLEKPNEFPPAGYSDTFCNFADDINQDGWDDLIVVDFPGKPTWWFENPGKPETVWERHLAVPVTNNESPNYVAIDGDGQRSLLCGTLPGKLIIRARPGKDVSARWPIEPISKADAPGTDRFSHGLGAGDINGDGRTDVVVTAGWWEAPAEANHAPWTFHPVDFGPDCAQMVVYDFDGDGDADVVTSSAHQFGIWWHEQTDKGFERHLIDKSFSQTHALCLADINGDHLPDLVTGKRWWAHGGHDPGSDQPAVVKWFELTREAGRPKWIAHTIDEESGIGTQFEVTDVNGDGLLDVVTSNKKGVFYFEQVRAADGESK